MRCSPALAILLAFALANTGFADDRRDGAITVSGKVSAVTVYQGQALVTRAVDLAEVSGLAEIVVTNLPANVIGSSLYAEPLQGVEIRSVRFRVRPMEVDVREEVRELDEQIQAVNDRLAANTRQQQVQGERQQYLTKLEQFTTVSANQELKSGVLNAETLKELTNFNFEQRDSIAEQQLELAREKRDLDRQLQTLQRKRNNVAAGSAQTLREAVVFVNVARNAQPGLKLSYLVSNATWSPSYNLRATADRDQVLVEYNASIQQMSGEDWTDVEMALSTATPSLVAQAPSLDPLIVKLGRATPELVAETAAGGKDYAKAKRKLEEQRKQIADNRGGANFSGQLASDELFADGVDRPQSGEAAMRQSFGGIAGGGRFGGEFDGDASGLQWYARDREAADRFLNEVAQKMQILDYNTARIEIKKREERQMVEGEGVSVSYQLASRMTLPSRSDRQLIQISAHPLQANFYRLATPVLTNSVYEEARPTNSSDEVLLAGPALTFLGDEFVGRGEVPTVSIGEKFSVGLGIDSSLRTRRELVDKDERIQGGNRVVDFTYELSIENFGDAPAKVRLLDRMPTAGESDIKITLLKSDQPVSEDRDYQQREMEDGLLRWDVEVPAGATGVDRFVLRYTMQIEYDKQLSIVGLPAKR